MKNNPVLRSLLMIAGLLAAGSATCRATVITGSDFASVGYGITQADLLYVIAAGSGYDNWALLTLDLSSVPASSISSDGTLTLYVDTTWLSSSLNATLVLGALQSAYDPGDLGAVGLPVTATELDTESFSGLVPGDAISFTIPEATLVSWASSPSTNYGLAIGETTWSGGAGHSDLTLSTGTGNPAPAGTFDTTPEPSTLVLFSMGLLALIAAARPSREFALHLRRR